MEISIRGNRESFQLYHKIDYLEIRLSGLSSFVSESPVEIYYGATKLTFPNRMNFFQYADKIKRASLERIILLSQEFNLPSEFRSILPHKGEIEIGMFKTIFLIYNWIDIALTDAYAVDLKSKIFDKFIIDYSSRPEVQKDIYFISSKYTNDIKYLPHIQRLIDLNLLLSAEFHTNVGYYNSYFIPLIKPGVSREYFKTEFDKSGSATYNLWKDILHDRDSKILYWLNHHNQ